MSFAVTLTSQEMATCRMLGNLRSIASRGTGIKDVQMGKQSPLEIDEFGIMGEYAFCKHFNIFFDPVTYARAGGYDCILRGKRVDIKTTPYTSGKLIATLKKNMDIDVFVLAIARNGGQVIEFPGYITANNLYQDVNVKDLGHGDTYAVDQAFLSPWKAE